MRSSVNQLRFYGFFLCFVFLSVSCATKTLLVKGTEGASASLVDFDSLTKDQKILGKIPVELNVDELIGKGIRISKEGKQSAYWLVAEASGEKTTLNIELLDIPPAAKINNQASINLVLRMTLNAYRELGRGRYAEAKQMAVKAGELAPDAAAPLAIVGVCQAKSGDLTGARASFMKAKALDPEDTNIPALMLSLGIK